MPSEEQPSAVSRFILLVRLLLFAAVLKFVFLPLMAAVGDSDD